MKNLIMSYTRYRQDEYEVFVHNKANKISYFGSLCIVVVLYLILDSSNPFLPLIDILYWSNILILILQESWNFIKYRGKTLETAKSALEDLNQQVKNPIRLVLYIILATGFTIYILYDIFTGLMTFIRLTG